MFKYLYNSLSQVPVSPGLRYTRIWWDGSKGFYYSPLPLK